MRVLFLYTELADYFLKCCEELGKNAEVHIIRWPINKEAPFKFTYSEKIKVYDKEKYSLEALNKLIEKISPTIIICSGWIDKDYLRITKRYHRKIPTVMSCDTRWRGTFKQYIAILLSRFYLTRIFSHAWVPGKSQRIYARKLGFKAKSIKEGFYSCDLEKFNKLYLNNIQPKQNNWPKRFLFVGRYYNFKGIEDLWKAFAALHEEEFSDWELWCLGSGDIQPIENQKIKHLGFVQPQDLLPIVGQCSVFVLPSRFEPWGVVVQEYAAAGFPLILSNSVGSAELFLQEGENGYSYSSGNIEELKAALKKIINLSSKDLILMSEKSHQLAQRNSPQKWTQTVIDIQNEKK